MEPGVIGSIKGDPILIMTQEELLLQRKLNAEKVRNRKDAIVQERQMKLVKFLEVEEEKNTILRKSVEEKARKEKNKYQKNVSKFKKSTPLRNPKVSSKTPKKRLPTIPNPLGFSVKTKRFLDLGYHPTMEKAGSLRMCPNIGPGTYNPEEVLKHVYAIDYAKSMATSDFSKTLGYKVPGMLAQRSWLKGGLGPANYDLSLCSCENNTGSVFTDTGFSTGERFTKVGGLKTPGPGSYGKNHIPHTLREENSCVRRTWTHVPSFEWSVTVAQSARKYHLPPNLYQYRDPGSISVKVATSVSKRGPYDIFTGPRDESTIKGYFATPKFKGSKTWPYELPDTNQLSKGKNGKWVLGPRFPRFRDHKFPGPAEYDPKVPACTKKGGHPPFNCSSLNVRPPPPYKLQPGVGRYNSVKPGHVNAHQSVFKSRDVRSQWMYPERFNDF